MEIVLHLGAHRTGTTTLQNYLCRHRAGLAARGIRSLLPARLRSPAFHGLVQARGGAAALAALAHEIAGAKAAGARIFLISEENLAGQLRGLLRAAAPYPDVGIRLSRLAPAFGDMPLRIGLALRPQADWWGSVLAYATAQGLHLPDGGEGGRLAAAPRGWAEVVADMAGACPAAQITLWPHAGWVARPRQLTAALTGIAALPGHMPVRLNNAAPDAATLRRALIAAGQPAAARHLPRHGRWQPFTPEQRRLFAARDAAGLAQITAMAGVTLLGTPDNRPETPDVTQAPPCAPHPPEGGASDGRFGQVA